MFGVVPVGAPSWAINKRKAALRLFLFDVQGTEYLEAAESVLGWLNPLTWLDESGGMPKTTFYKLAEKQGQWLSRIEAGEDARANALQRWDNAFIEIVAGWSEIKSMATMDLLKNYGITAKDIAHDTVTTVQNTGKGAFDFMVWLSKHQTKLIAGGAVIGGLIVLNNAANLFGRR